MARNLIASHDGLSYSDLETYSDLYYSGLDTLWMLTASALILLMIPALCLFYSSVEGRTSTLQIFRLPLITTAVVGAQWYFWGYTLAFSYPTSIRGFDVSAVFWYGGDAGGVVFKDVLVHPVSIDRAKVPELVYVLFEGMLACFTAALVASSAINKIGISRFLVFIILWTTLVYDAVARWSMHPQGWSKQRGSMDFAGGTAVHITSGTTVAALTVFYAYETQGFKRCMEWFVHIWSNRVQQTFRVIFCQSPPRKNGIYMNKLRMFRQASVPASEPAESKIVSQINGGLAAGQCVDPEGQTAASPCLSGLANNAPRDVNNMVVGAVLLWIGWLGFNGGSARSGNLRAVSALVSTQVAAYFGGTASFLICWLSNTLTDCQEEKQHPWISFCDGAIAALVAISPASGYVPVWSSGIFGVVSSIGSVLLRRELKRFFPNDRLDIFVVHTGSGWIGMVLTGFFAESQLVDVFAGSFYAFFMTLAILYFLKYLQAPFRRNEPPCVKGNRFQQWNSNALQRTIANLICPKFAASWLTPALLISSHSEHEATVKESTKTTRDLNEHAIPPAGLSSRFDDLSVSDRLKIYIQQCTTKPIIWWPLATPRKPIATDQTRLVWKCKCCAESLFLGIPNALAEALSYETPRKSSSRGSKPSSQILIEPFESEISQTRHHISAHDENEISNSVGRSISNDGLSQGRPQHPENTSCLPQSSPSSTWGSSTPTVASTIASGKSPNKVSSSQRPQRRYPPEALNACTNITHPQDLSTTKWVHWCIGSAKTRLQEICVYGPAGAKKGRAFIQELKDTYKRIRGIAWWFSLRELRQVKIVKFVRLFDGQDLVVCNPGITIDEIRKAQDYEISIAENLNDLHILIVEETLAHCLNRHSSRLEDSEVDSVIPSLPKRIGGGLGTKGKVCGYGIKSVQGWSVFRFLLLFVVSTVVGLIFMSVWLWKHPQDLQGASVLYLIALSVLFGVISIVDRYMD